MNTRFCSHPLVVDKHLAKTLGLNEALLLQQVNYWLEINKKKNRNYHQGRYWTYNTLHEWQEEFPFWSVATVKRTFKKLKEANLIITDNFNNYQMDRTLWYTINYEELEKLMGEGEIPSNISVQSTDGCVLDTEGQNHTIMGSNCMEDDQKNDLMDGSKLTPPLPEISTEISSNISNPSIHPYEDEKINGERQRERRSLSPDELEIKYMKIIGNCELFFLDEKYREAAAHAIKLLLLDMEKCKSIKIGDYFIPVELMEKDIHKLNFFVIEHAVNKFKEASTKTEIRNTVAYLKACIYNAINEMKLEMDSRLRYVGLIG